MRKKLHTLLAAAVVTISGMQNASAQDWHLAGNSDASSSSKLGTTNNVNLRLFTNNNERMRINASNGWVGVGTTAPRGRFTLYNGASSVPAASWVTATSPMLVSYADATAGNGDFYLLQASNTVTTRSNIINRRARGTLVSPTAVANNDYIGSFQASGYDGSAFQNAANIDFFADGTPSSGNVPIRIAFSTGTNLGNRTQRLVIKSNGNVGIGTASPSNKLHVIGRGRFSDGLSIEESGIYSVHTTGNGIEAYGNTSYGIGAYGSGNFGVYGNSTNSAYGVYGVSSSAYSANGSSGVYGTGYYGVQGNGTLGVYGTGTSYGLYGVGNGAGTYGSVSYGGYVGAYGSGDSYGVYGFSSAGTAVYGTSYGDYTTEGYAGQFVSNNYRGIRVASATGWIAGYFEGDVYTTGTYLTSDARVKKNVTDFKDAMSIINKLQPKYYEYKHDGNYAKMNLPQGLHYGLIAQDVEKILPQLVRDASTNTKLMQPAKELKITPGAEAQKVEPVTGETIELKAVNYTELIPILVKAMQEQQAEIENLKTEISRIKNGQNGAVYSGAGSLGVATPNPVRDGTRISYNLPSANSRGQLLLTDAAGKAVKAVSLNGSGYVDLNTVGLSSGIYNYSLLVDGKIVASKKLEIARNR
jgi:hypothetical protein